MTYGGNLGFIRQSTAVTVPIGHLVDATDGFTLETSVALAGNEAHLLKAGAANLLNIAANTWAQITDGASYTATGIYGLVLTASNTDTLGPLDIYLQDSAHRPVHYRGTVIPANVYDSLVLGTDLLDINASQLGGNAIAAFLNAADGCLLADIRQINDSGIANFISTGGSVSAMNADIVKVNTNTTAATNMRETALGITLGTVQSGSTTTVIKTNLTETTNDHYNGQIIAFTTGALAGQKATVLDYSGTSRDLTISAITEAPSNGDSFVLV